MDYLVRIQSATPLTGFRVRLEFTDGTTREADLEQYLHGPVFEPLRNDSVLFRSMTVDPRAKTITWPNGADIDPDVLYHGLTPAWRESPAENSVV